MRLLLAIILLLPISTNATDTVVKLEGTVADSEGAAIGNAFVMIRKDGSNAEDLDWKGRTNSNGKVLTSLPEGFYDVFVSSPAFTPASLKVRLKSGSSGTFKAVLHVDPLVSEERGDIVEPLQR
jgi:hypothetical protein